uniref:EGF-like domain-containing protein n=1 Tax=Monopterus albus TaxID=43700 RepID=A0A3Q3IFZ1_MONAL
MAFPRPLASMLLASLILLLYWTTSSARSHDPTSSNLSALYRMKRDLPPRTKETTDKILENFKQSLSVFKDVMGSTAIKTLAEKAREPVTKVITKLANIASLAPGIGSLVFSFISTVLAFIPQEDPVLKEVKEGFTELNRKLDSLSAQISNLVTDVEWFNYASTYSQDEVRILNTWKKFNEFRENSVLVESEEDKLRLAQIFTSYYENTGAEASVANLYHYLTVSSTSLSGNINELLNKKFKCDIADISKYNLYFSSLLLKGMILNQLYWNLIGFNPSGKEDEQTQMFKNVYKAQVSAIYYCLNNSEQYMKEDVKEIATKLRPDDKQAITHQVKKALDQKYNWYDWVVLVYNENDRDNYLIFDMIKIPVGTITVAVGHTRKADFEFEEEIRQAAIKCFENEDCRIHDALVGCSYTEIRDASPGWRHHDSMSFRKNAKATHVTYGENIVFPPPFIKLNCEWDGYKNTGKRYIYYSRTLPVCTTNPCENSGTCKKLLDSNEWLCECPDGFYGDRCENNIIISKDIATDNHQSVPDISTISTKLKVMEAKLEEILNTINVRCHQ